MLRLSWNQPSNQGKKTYFTLKNEASISLHCSTANDGRTPWWRHFLKVAGRIASKASFTPLPVTETQHKMKTTGKTTTEWSKIFFIYAGTLHSFLRCTLVTTQLLWFINLDLIKFWYWWEMMTTSWWIQNTASISTTNNYWQQALLMSMTSSFKKSMSTFFDSWLIFKNWYLF